MSKICPGCDAFGSTRWSLSEISLALSTPLELLDLQTSFIDNGGDSFSSTRLQSACRSQGIPVSLDIIFSTTTLLDLAESITSVIPKVHECTHSSGLSSKGKRYSEDASNFQSKRLRLSTHETAAVNGIPTGRMAALTEMQSSLVRSSLKNPNRNVISYFETHPTEALSALKHAWKAVLGSEDIFRMRVDMDEFAGYLCENEEMEFQWVETVVEDEVSYQQELKRPVSPNLVIGASFTVITLRSPHEECRSTLIWRVHHAFIDGTSFELLRGKIQRVLSGQRIHPGPSFSQFSVQLRELQQRRNEVAIEFWKRQKENYPYPATQLAFGMPSNNPTPSTYAVGEVHFDIDVTILDDLCKRAGITIASLYHAAWGLALAKYTGTSHVCFGVVLSGRSLPIEGVESVIGPTINTLPLYVALDSGLAIEDYLREIFRSLLGLIAVQWSTPSQGFSRNFASAVNISPLGSSADCTARHCHFEVQSDIPIQVEVEKGGQIRISYDSSMFLKSHMQRLGATFVRALDAINNRAVTVGSIMAALNRDEEAGVLAKMGNWASQAARIDSVNEDLVSIFVRTAGLYPAAIAVEHPLESLTYAELDRRSSHVARHLVQYVSPGDVVCVNADITVNWIVAIYAVLKAGATYCPFDPDLPESVRATNFTATRATLFLTGSVGTKHLKPTLCELCLSVEELLSNEANAPHIPINFTSPDMHAYLCFTSGSTGRPKGVICRHRGLVAFQKDLQVRLGARPGWRIAQFMSPAFDGSIHEVFSALSYGATLVLKNPSRPFAHLQQVDAAILTPSMAQSLDVADFPHLKSIYLVGEAVSQRVCDLWAVKDLFNMYGPTEATCGATIKALKAKEQVTLGRPNPSTRVYLLDDEQKLVPWGVIGEIYLSGIQVAAGYIGLPDVTASRFLPNTIKPEYQDESMYKTGDRAYWTEDGELAFVGRSDREVKLRGFRVDLDDLEIRMVRAHTSCTAAAVTVHNDQLMAWVQPPGLSLISFKRDIAQHIPSYSLPHWVRAVGSFPTTPIGKLDYKAIVDTAHMEPCQDVQEMTQFVIYMLRDVFSIPSSIKIDVNTRIADLGADSVIHLSLLRRLSRHFKQHIPLKVLLESSTVQHLARTLEGLKEAGDTHTAGVLGDDQVSPIERDWWRKYQLSDQTSSFNVSYACNLSSSVNKDNLVSAWNLVLRRHRILSCRYTMSPVHGLIREYARQLPTVQRVEQLDLSISSVPFDLRNDHLVRIYVSPTAMLVVISHIICDLTTLKILLQEVADTYMGRPLLPVSKAYAESVWSVPAMPNDLSFWKEWLADAPPCPLPASMQAPRARWTGTSQLSSIPESVYNGMLEFGAFHNFSMHQLALAAVALVLQHETDTCDITIGAPYMNRNSEEDVSVVGLFLEPLTIRIRFPESSHDGSLETVEAFVSAVKHCSRQALSHAIPWDQLLSHLNIETDYPNHPIFDVMVTFHDVDHDVQFPIEGAEFVPTWTDGAKFKLMVEFTARQDESLGMRLEYSDECFTKDDAELMALLLIEALSGLTSGVEYLTLLRMLRDLKSSHDRVETDLVRSDLRLS
jgi:amino acid adenylation domain-containing protein